MNDIRQRLDMLGFRAREKATWAHFVEKGYTVYGTPDEADLVNVVDDGVKELTMSRYQEGDGFLDSNFDYKVTQGGEVWNHVHGEYDWIETAFDKHGHADLDAIYGLKNAVTEAAKQLCADPGWTPTSTDTGEEAPSTLEGSFGSSEREVMLLVNGMDQLSHWTGTAANAFYGVFGADGTYWGHRLHGDFVMLIALIAVLEAKIQTVYATRHAVVQMGENVIDALDVVAVSGSGSDPSVPLAILGSLAAIAFSAAFPLATPVAGAVMGAVIGVGTEVIKGMANGDQDPGIPGGKDLTLDGDTVSAVLSSFSDHMGTIRGDYETREGEIAGDVSALYGECLTYRKEDFQIDFGDTSPLAGTTKDNMYDADRLGDSDVTVDPEKLIIGAGEFTTAADLVLEVNAALAATSESNLDGPPFYRDVTSGSEMNVDTIQDGWCSLRDLAQDVLAHNGGILQQTAQILLWAAEDYPSTDDASAQTLQDATDTLEGSGTAVSSGNDHDTTSATLPAGGPNDAV